MQRPAFIDDYQLSGKTRPKLLKAINLECLRGDYSLFSRLNFQLKAGECLLVQGQNGSGKTSLLRMIAGLATPAAGSLYWNGCRIRQLDDEYRHELLYLGHALGLKEELSAMENLSFASVLANKPVSSTLLREALHRAGLRGKEDMPVRILSQGQKRRVSLTRLLLQRRALWILDEPFTALDADASQWATETIDQHVKNGGIAVLTTHHDMKLTHVTQFMRMSA